MISMLGKTSLFVAIVACLALPAAASASSTEVIRDCAADGTLDGKYSQGELQGALNGLPSDVDEYTDCRSVIRSATLTKAGGDKAGSPSASVSRVDPNAPPSADEQGALDKAAGSDQAVKIGDEEVKPGEAGFLAAGFNNDVPALLVALIVMFALATLGGTALAFQRRWPEAAATIGGTVARPFKAVGRGVKGGVSRFRR